MGFVLIGLLLLLLKLGGWYEFSKSEFVSWMIVICPFALATVWWWWSDTSGRTQRKAMEALDERKEARRQQLMKALGREDRKR